MLNNKHVNNKDNNVAIVLAAGNSSRMLDQDKIFISILGKPLLYYSLKVFEESPIIDSIVLVMSQKNIHLKIQESMNRITDEHCFSKHDGTKTVL